MALVTVPTLWVPKPWPNGNSPAFVSTLLDAAADRVASIIIPTIAGDLATIKVRFGTVPALGGTTTITVGVQGVSLTTGDPDGTFLQSFTIPNGSILANTTYEGTLGAVQTLARNGTRYAIVAQYGTFNAGDQVNLNALYGTATRQNDSGFAYPDINTTGSYAKVSTGIACFSLGYSGGLYYPVANCLPVGVPGTIAYNSGSANNSIGLRFRWPTPIKLSQVWSGIDADGDFNVRLYDASTGTTVCTCDKDVRGSTTFWASPIPFTADQTLAANTTYVLAIEPTTATSVTLSFLDVGANAELGQLESGIEMYYAAALNPTNASSFTVTNTRWPLMGLGITAMDDGVGGGGGPLIYSAVNRASTR